MAVPWFELPPSLYAITTLLLAESKAEVIEKLPVTVADSKVTGVPKVTSLPDTVPTTAFP